MWLWCWFFLGNRSETFTDKYSYHLEPISGLEVPCMCPFTLKQMQMVHKTPCVFVGQSRSLRVFQDLLLSKPRVRA